MKFDDVIRSGFWVIPKLTSASLCNPIHDINIPLSFVLLNLEGVEKKQKNYNLNNLIIYLENEKSFLDEIKSIF